MGSVTKMALYCDDDLSFLVRRWKENYTLGDGEIRIETIYSGVNPADVKHARILGIHPAVLGYDFCGKVLEGPVGSKFQSGDLVAGYTPTGLGRPAKYGTHQQDFVCPEDMLFLVPPNLPPHHAACLSVVTMTACDALYNIFRFPLPAENLATDTSSTSSPLLIWGASSSVGISAVQLARASRIYPILVTASPKHHPLLLRLGATRCFDYKSPHIVSDIQSVLEQEGWNPISRGFDAVGSEAGLGSAQLMAGCVPKDAALVSVVMQKDPRFRMPFAPSPRDVELQPKGVPHSIKISARKVDFERAWAAFQWAVAHYGTHFQLPSVEVFHGSAEDALGQVLELVDHGRGLGKLVFQHPLQ